jgi:hypothetical protein
MVLKFIQENELTKTLHIQKIFGKESDTNI